MTRHHHDGTTELDANGRPVIDADHLDHASAIAAKLARTTTLGNHAGVDELKSEALVALWDLALAWNPESGVPFGAYISMYLRARLVDWLRSVYGRDNPERWDAALGMVSSDAAMESGISYDRADPAPLGEDVVLARERLATVIEAANETCTPRQRDALLWPLTDDDATRIAAKWNMSRVSAATHRNHAKARVREALAVLDRDEGPRIPQQRTAS